MTGPLNEFVAAVREDITAWCIAAIVSSALLLLVYSCLPDVRRTPGWQFLFSSICEIYVAVGFLVLSLDEAQVDPATGIPDVERMLCADYRVLVITVLAFDAAANNWDCANWETNAGGINCGNFGSLYNIWECINVNRGGATLSRQLE